MLKVVQGHLFINSKILRGGYFWGGRDFSTGLLIVFVEEQNGHLNLLSNPVTLMKDSALIVQCTDLKLGSDC